MSAGLFKPGLISAIEVFLSRSGVKECEELIKEHPEMDQLDGYNLEQAALQLAENANFCEKCALMGITVVAPKSYGKEFAS